MRLVRATPDPVPRAVQPPSEADFRKAYESYFDYVWRCIRRLGVAQAQLDDATQDVFVVVYRRFGEFEGRSSMRTWIYGIALRVARDYRRRANRRAAPEALSEAHVDPRPGPLDSVTTAEALRTVLGALDRLDEDKREVFVMAELEGLTAPEMAEVLSVPLNTVYSRLRAARAAFERVLPRSDGSER